MKGQLVNWTNIDESPHQVTVQGSNTLPPGDLQILKGQRVAMRFDHPGTYDYICGLHPGMKGKIEV